MTTLIFTVTALALVGLAWPALSLAPWVPVRRQDLARILALAKLAPDEVFYDLGCGNGRLVFHVAKNSPAKAGGVELSFIFYLICRIRQFCQRRPVFFRLNDLYRENLHPYDVVFVFAQSRAALSARLQTKLRQELRPGSRVISYVFPFDNWPAQAVSKPTSHDLAIYLYKL